MFAYIFLCAGVEATVERTSYTVDEDIGVASITILLDQTTCKTITITVTPQVQSPVDASSKRYTNVSVVKLSFLIASDFDNTPIAVDILPGDTTAIASIPIIDDTIVEGPESFDVVLTPGSSGVMIGTPGQTEVTIIDNDSECLRVIIWVV